METMRAIRIFLLLAVIVHLYAKPLPSPTSCVFVSEKLGFLLHVTESGDLAASAQEEHVTSSNHFFPHYRGESTVGLEVEAQPGFFVMASAISQQSNSSGVDTKAAYAITAGVPQSNSSAEWKVTVEWRGTYLSLQLGEGVCYAAFYEKGANCEPALNDNSWVEMLCY